MFSCDVRNCSSAKIERFRQSESAVYFWRGLEHYGEAGHPQLRGEQKAVDLLALLDAGEKLQAERNQVGRAKRKVVPKSKADPVRKGAKARRMVAKAERERRNEYFRQQAIDRAIERNREKQLHGEE